MSFKADGVTDIHAFAVSLHFEQKRLTHAFNPHFSEHTSFSPWNWNFSPKYAAPISEVRDNRQRANECRWAHPAFQPSTPLLSESEPANRRAIKWDIASQLGLIISGWLTSQWPFKHFEWMTNQTLFDQSINFFKIKVKSMKIMCFSNWNL